MSVESLINEANIQKKKQAIIQAVNDGKAALRALALEAVDAKSKPFEEIPDERLQSHLSLIKTKKAEIHKLRDEIRDLE